MSKTLKDRLDYLIALVSEFAATHHLSLQQAYLYLQQYKKVLTLQMNSTM